MDDQRKLLHITAAILFLQTLLTSVGEPVQVSTCTVVCCLLGS